MDECASKYNRRAEETTYILATLLQSQTDRADNAGYVAGGLRLEIEDLEFSLAEVKRERDERDDEINNLHEEINDRHNEMMDLRDRLKNAEKTAEYRGRALDDLVSEIEGLNEFISGVDALVKDEDWYELRVQFGYADVVESSPTGYPEYLETEEDYESAPIGTLIMSTGQSGGRWFWEKVGRNIWNASDSEVVLSTAMLAAGAPRKVYQWGTGSVKGLGNSL